MKPTEAQERALRKLFDGNHLDREQIVSQQRREMREPMRKLMKAKGNADNLFAIMFADLGHASGEMKANPGDQFWRRMTIRTLAATLDGIIFCLKETALATGSFNGYKFTDDQVAFLTETMQTSGKRPKFLPFRDNLIVISPFPEKAISNHWVASPRFSRDFVYEPTCQTSIKNQLCQLLWANYLDAFFIICNRFAGVIDIEHFMKFPGITQLFDILSELCRRCFGLYLDTCTLARAWQS